ncbi:MAG: hypothetical protein JRJ87_16430 [Deltaproteobacteria bacterium]|nr:hypothetical protein [Deltaproteobacteria bacterium]
MNRTYRFYFITILATLVGISCVVGVSVGLWTVLDQAGASVLVVRGLLALLIVIIISLILALIFARAIKNPVRELAQAIDKLRLGNFQIEPSIDNPQELCELAGNLRELGVFLEERDRQAEQKNRQGSREQRREALSRFGKGVAREVQKSLAGVLGYIEIALRQPGVEGQLKNYLTLIDQEAREGREALERVLRYVRKEDFPTELVDLNTLLLETSRSFMDTLEKDKIQVQLNLAQDLPRIMGDAGQIRYVLTSLIENARESMLPAGGSLELSATVNQDQQVVIMVKDSGIGIPQEDHSRVFTPFFTSKGNQKGAGLSLAIAERIVDQHGGRLDFWSTPEQGSVFFVNFPPGQG